MKFKYDVSVIIPIYNRELTLLESVDSVLKQEYEQNKIEIILINDGSTDRSKEICLDLIKKYDNIKYFEHENRGVSFARNVGLKNAKGKYITFLDSDDNITPDTIKSLYVFFENHYNDTDLVTYPIYNFNNGKKRAHIRHVKSFKESDSDIYNLKDNPEKLQSNINIMIKNNINLPRFNESLKQHEDQVFITEILSKKSNIGYVNCGAYKYNRSSENSVSKLLSAPYYSFEECMNIYMKWIEDYKETKMFSYIQNLILYNISWKLICNQFYPYNNVQPEFEEYKDVFVKLLKNIDVKNIFKSPYLEYFHKNYLLNLKGNPVSKVSSSHNYVYYKDEEILRDINTMWIVINNISVKKNNMVIEGFIKNELLNNEDIKMFYKHKNENHEVKLEYSTESHYKSIVKTNDFKKFVIETKIKDGDSFYFYFLIGKTKLQAKCYLKSSLGEALSKTRKYFTKQYEINFKHNSVLIKHCKIKEYLKYKKQLFCYFYNKNPKIILNRLLKKACFRKTEIWLYNDRKLIKDNGYYQFEHDIKIKDNIKRYLVLDESKTKIKECRKKLNTKNIIKFKSLKHKILFLNASKILTSFSEYKVFAPYGNSYYNYIDLTDFQVIYLQHGILHAHLPKLYSKESSSINKIVISSKFEEKNLLKYYSYDSKDLIRAGMSRLDKLKKSENSKKEKRILIALSWRTNLVGILNSKTLKRELYVNLFKESEYFIETEKLFKSKQLEKVINKNNLKIHFMSHPNFRDYNKYYNNINNIRFVDSADPKDYSLIITDYSSIVFDYVYSEIPVLYFVPDYELFKAGVSHNYNKLDLPLEEGFGALTFNSKNLILELEKIIKNNFQIEKKYKNRYESFFLSKNNQREKIYNYLVKEGEE